MLFQPRHFLFFRVPSLSSLVMCWLLWFVGELLKTIEVTTIGRRRPVGSHTLDEVRHRLHCSRVLVPALLHIVCRATFTSSVLLLGF